tara:strand:- start:363 stop:548 length:186 start_codon:yes stop_codon:yes gene_type:complete
MEKMTEIESTKGRGLVAGYEPNKLSLYILLLESRRLDELYNLLWKDMEKYKTPEKIYKEKE